MKYTLMLFSNNSYTRLLFQESSRLALTAPHATHPEMVVGFGRVYTVPGFPLHEIFITITLFKRVPLFLLLDKDLLYAWGEIFWVFFFCFLIILLTSLFKNTTKCL